MEPYSLYFHVPFCRHRCSYCDFNTFAHQERHIAAYGKAVCQEVSAVSRLVDEPLPVHSIFFGGGTPSLLPLNVFESIFQTIEANYTLIPEIETTIEANPGTVTLDYLKGLRKLGVNRLSFGMQSAHPDDLRLLEREHDFFDVSRAVTWARQAGFDNLSLDLIFGLPEQPLQRWRDTLARAVGLQPEHLSVYGLTIEPGTPLEKRFRRGLIPRVDEDLSADMYETAMDFLAGVGYEQYEISNWAARRGTENGGALLACRHNLQYWLNQPYLGFGAGAHGYAAGVRTANVGGILPYITRCMAEPKETSFPSGPATRRALTIDTRTEMQETMLTGLRLTQVGVSEANFQARFGQKLDEVFGKEVDYLSKAGLLERTPSAHLRLTRRGRMLGNQVFMRFLG